MASAKERTNCWAQLAAVLGGTEGLEGGAGREWELEIELNVEIGVPWGAGDVRCTCGRSTMDLPTAGKFNRQKHQPSERKVVP